MSKLQSAFADQFFARDHWISAKLRIDQLLGQKESNGVYLCQDNYLIEIPEAPDPAVLDRTLTAMKEFAAKHDDLRMTAMIVPNASLVMRDYLPANAPAHNQQEDLFTVNQALSPCMQYADVTLALKAHVRDGVFTALTTIGQASAHTAPLTPRRSCLGSRRRSRTIASMS